ncbi:hypothetical protein PHLCEN_2v11789 [Hermanssonia centrifuga]|uniref:Uncharacterized protein n=1 Tax=Hermanssonia centrifuga TaxID=98765 RepID=A0A2R6NJ61_9APHY|nr:hypothetical protein PHLCEN_2v11789 [Hermanssonia centrifuga]
MDAHMDPSSLEIPDFLNGFFPQARVNWLTPDQLKANVGEDPSLDSDVTLNQDCIH